MFDHEKLQVYGKALDFAAKAAAWTSTWDKKHALVDHLSRATESILLSPSKPSKEVPKPLFHHEGLEVYRAALGFMEWFVSRAAAKELSNRLFRQIDEAGTSVVLNIAEGNGRYAELDHHRFLQIAQSAAVKGAVFLDLGVERAFLLETEATAGKEMLRRISAMVAGF
jgi:four helix bundle protein